MKKGTKIFIIALILSLPFWWGINNLKKNLSDFFFWYELSKNPQIFITEINPERKLGPIRNKNIEDLEIEAKSAISILLTKNGTEKTLFEKDINNKLPLASLTKLMTAYVILENYNLSKEIKVTKEAVNQEGDFGKLEIGRIYTVEYLLYPLLMESSNDAAFALVNDYEGMNRESFVGLMNQTAEKINLESTYFFNPTGLEPEEDKLTAQLNYSTVANLVKLTKELLKKPLIWEILSTPAYSLYGPELRNTNELLWDEALSWRTMIVGGKTGYTEKAGGCIVLVLKTPKNKGYLINIILGTKDNNERFNEMKKLVEWLNLAYKW